jgi:uncharacterized protein
LIARILRVHRAAWLVLAALLVFAVALPAADAADPKFPALTGRVVDEANLLSADARERIIAWLADFERQSGRQVVVVTVKSLQGVPIEDYGYRLGRAWGIGEKDKNTGAILLVAPNERTVRVEVGYGLEGELTDARSRVIIEGDILPAFRQGEFERGIMAGTISILRTLGWMGDPGVRITPAKPQRDTGGGLPLGLIFFLLIFFAFRYFGRRAWIAPFGIGMWGAGSRNRYGGFGGGFGGSGGGGFSGGGGSFGGGGATGKW